MHARTVNALECNFRNASGQHIVTRGEAYRSKRMNESQRSRRGGIARHCGAGGNEQILLVGDSRRNRIGDRRSTGLRLVRKNDSLSVVRSVGKEADMPPATRPTIGGRPARSFRNLDIVHIIRQAGGLVPGSRVNGCQHAERIVESSGLDGGGSGYRLLAIRTYGTCFFCQEGV